MKRWLWLLIAACLPFPALSQTMDWRKDPEITEAYSEAYTQFFNKVWILMEHDIRQMMERDRVLRNACPDCPAIPPPEVGLKSADGWLAQRLFNPRDIEQIEIAVSQWHRASTPFVGDQRYAGIALNIGTKLESQLEDRRHFDYMMRDCAHRLRFAPETDDSRCFALPKPRFT